MKFVKCVYWSRYNQEDDFKWIHIKGWNQNKIATRGIWISGKYSYNIERRTRPPIIRFLNHIKYPSIPIPKNVSREELFNWIESIKSWSSFSKKLINKKHKKIK